MSTKKTSKYRQQSGDEPQDNLADYIENPDNPQRIDERDFEKLVASVKRFPQMLAVRQIAYVTDAANAGGKRVVLGGNKRLRALKAIHGEGGMVPSAWFRDITAMTEAERREFLVKDNVQAGEWDPEKLLAQFDDRELENWGVDVHQLMVELTEQQEAAEAAQGEGDATDLDAASVDDLKLDERMQAAKYVFFAFSGGRDSTRAVYLTARKFIETGKKCEAVFVQSAFEFPDIIMHVRRVCAEVGLPLKVLYPQRDLYTEFIAKGKMPDSIFMPCVEACINRPMDEYIESVTGGNEDYILVRGGQAKQKTARSHTALTQNPKSKPRLLIYNPLFAATDAQLAVPIPEWRGYSMGFKRTCCWACPFQHADHYRSLKLNYPALYEEMKLVVASVRFPFHKGDTSNKRKFEYWEREEGIEIKWY